MKTMKWLIRREFWENKGMFIWTPLVMAALMVVGLGIASAYGIAVAGPHVAASVQPHVTMNGIPMEAGGATKTMIAHALAGGYMATSAPFVLMLSLVVFFYCLGSLYEDRRDRSVLFWKSLPVSDSMTVLSKVAMALVAAPLVILAVATVTSLILAVVIAISLAVEGGVNVIGALLSDPQFYLSPLQVLSLLPVYALWSLPTLGWLLMVSSWARSKVFLWAVGTPLMSLLVLKWIIYLTNVDWKVEWFAENIVGRGLFSMVPGAWLAFERVSDTTMLDEHTHGVDISLVFGQSWQTLTHANVWIGAVAGAAMIYVAIRMRRWREEG
jgi:ABC-2 type transport system permease protein